MKKYILFLITLCVFLSLHNYTLSQVSEDGTPTKPTLNFGGNKVEIDLAEEAGKTIFIDVLENLFNIDGKTVRQIIDNLEKAKIKAKTHFDLNLPELIKSKILDQTKDSGDEIPSTELIEIILNDKNEYIRKIAETPDNSFGLTEEKYTLIHHTALNLKEEFLLNFSKVLTDTLTNSIITNAEPSKVLAIVNIIEQVKRGTGQEDFFKEINKSSEKPAVQISLGANFDFINGINTNAVYAEIGGFLTEVWTPFKYDDFSKFGIDIGLINNRSITTSERDNLNDFYFESIPDDDTLRKQISNEIEQVIETSQEYLSVFFSPTFKLTKYLYFATHFEFRKVDVTKTTEFSLTNPDTSIVDSRNIAEEVLAREPFNLEESKEEKFTVNESIFGFGGILYIDDHPFTLKVKMLIGWNTEPGRIFSSEFNKSFGYNTSFSLVEKGIGLKLGGQLRGLFDSGKPEFSIYLTKQFPVSKLLDFLGG